MEKLLKTLNNIRSLRLLAKEISLEQLETIFQKLELVVKEEEMKWLNSKKFRKHIKKN